MRRLPERIESERLVLRAWTVEDVDRLAEAVTDNVEHLRPWMAWIANEPMTRPDRLALVERWRRDRESGGDLVVGAFLDDDVVGGGGLHARIGPGGLEVGYWVHHRHVRRRFATEIAAAVTAAAFGCDDIDRVEIHHDKANEPSAGIPRRLGFELVAEVPDPPEAPGESGIECRWRLSRSAWAGPAAALRLR